MTVIADGIDLGASDAERYRHLRRIIENCVALDLVDPPVAVPVAEPSGHAGEVDPEGHRLGHGVRALLVVVGGSQLDVPRAVRAMGGSKVGRKHYLDLGSQLLDPTPSAEAVRGLLEEALAVGTRRLSASS